MDFTTFQLVVQNHQVFVTAVVSAGHLDITQIAEFTAVTGKAGIG